MTAGAPQRLALGSRAGACGPRGVEMAGRSGTSEASQTRRPGGGTPARQSEGTETAEERPLPRALARTPPSAVAAHRVEPQAPAQPRGRCAAGGGTEKGPARDTKRCGRRRGRRRGPRPGVALGLRWAGGGRDWARRLRAEEVHGPPLRFSGRIRHAHPHSDLGLLPPELGDDTFLLFRAGRLCSLSEQPQETKPGAEVQGPRAGPHPSHDPPPHARVPVGHSGRWGAGGYRTFPRDMGGPLAKCHSSASSRLP